MPDCRTVELGRMSWAEIAVPGQAHPATLCLDIRDVAPNGVTGDHSVATAERGQFWIERVVAYTVAFIRHYDEVTASAEWAK